MIQSHSMNTVTNLKDAWQERRDHEYSEYLRSKRWRKIRQITRLRADGKCEACLRRDGQDCAHLTYKRIFNERLSDLVWLCRQCHQEIDRICKQEAGQ